MTILGFSFRCIRLVARWLISPMAMAILFIHAMVDYGSNEDEEAAEYFRQEAKKWFAGR
jgi:hypothetical protein